jgi:diguanylate cyclase (GGDEF)-like protein
MVLNRISKSIKIKLMLMLLLAGSIPMFTSMVVIHERSEQILLDKTTEQMIESVTTHESMLNDHIEALRNDAGVIAQLPSIKSYMNQLVETDQVDDPIYQEAGTELAVFQQRLWGQTHHIFLTDATGKVVITAPKSGWEDGQQSTSEMHQSQGPHTGDSISDAHFFNKALKQASVTDFFGFSERDHFHQLVLHPIRDDSGETIGLVVIEVAIDAIDETMHDDFTIGKSGRLYLATTEGRRVVHLKSAYNPEILDQTGVLEALGTDAPVVGWYEPTPGREVYGVYHASRIYPWVVCIEVDRAEVEAPMRAQQRLFIFISLASIFVFAVIVYMVGQLFWKPLKKVVAAAELIADGDLWHEIETTRDDEIGHLEIAVDSMRVALKQQIDHLDATVAERTAELEYVNEKLVDTSEHDRLTGLANRDVLDKSLDHELGEFHKDPNRLVAALFFDFDRFKVVNDSLGHATGDALLCSIADRFRGELRDSDLPSRFGGDEFVVMLSQMESAGQIREAANRLLKLFEIAHIIDGHRIVSTASIGLVIADERYTSAEEMIRDADAAMYEAKLAGKGQVVVFDEAMFEDAKRRLKLEEDLDQAIENNELRVMYQPIIGMEEMDVTGFEALIRWEHPELGLVRPDHFIPIAEDTGQIVEIGAWILRESVEQMVRWDKEYGLDGTHSINVNVAKRQLIHPDFLGLVRRVLNETGLAPHRLKIEITESTAIDPRHDMSVVISRIRQLGVLIAMDDFGTGHSSLSLLHKFEFDILKIDQSFVQGMEESRDMSAVLHAIIALAQNTGMLVVAEGAETKGQVACLISHGCDMVQGYYFARPLPVAEAGAFLDGPMDFAQAA